jgi:DNA-binding IclR family transcriptional regulator
VAARLDMGGEIAMYDDDEDKQSSGDERAGSRARKRNPGEEAADAGGKARAGKGGAGKARAGTGGAGKARAGKGGAGKARADAGSSSPPPPPPPPPPTPTPRIKPEPDPRLSRSLEYGIAILESFSGERQALGIAEMADIVGISRSTTHRYAITLVALGYLEQDPKRRYRLSTRAAGPGSAAIGAIRRLLPARAVLEELRDETGHTVSMGVLDGARVIYIHRLLGHRLGQYAIDRDLGVGANVPAHCTALGKVLLASLSNAERSELLASIELTRHGPSSITRKKELAAVLDRISARGVVVSDEELVAGSRSIAVLVPRPRSEHSLAIDVTVPSAAYTVNRLVKEIGPRVKRAARLISGE